MRTEVRSGIFFLAVSLLVLGESLRVELGTFREPGSGFLPFFVGIALGSLSLALIWRGRGVRETLHPHSRRVVIALAALFAYSLLLDIFGFVLPTFLLVALLFRLGEPRRWWVIGSLSAGLTVVSYVVFGILLGVYFPRGLFGM